MPAFAKDALFNVHEAQCFQHVMLFCGAQTVFAEIEHTACQIHAAFLCTAQVESVQLASESAHKQVEVELANAKHNAAQAAAAHKSAAASWQGELDWQKSEVLPMHLSLSQPWVPCMTMLQLTPPDACIGTNCKTWSMCCDKLMQPSKNESPAAGTCLGSGFHHHAMPNTVMLSPFALFVVLPM